jgi:hypothetical protein
MIKALDLMPNNWIQGPDGKPYQVKSWEEADKIDGAGKITTVWLINASLEETWSPILLTPELMEKIKWIKTVDTLQRKEFSPTGKKGDFNTVHFNYGKYNLDKPKECIYAVRRIHYLHELQNMYRWENGTPLSITL